MESIIKNLGSRLSHEGLLNLGILLPLLFLAGCDGCQEADVGVTSMEITQGIQTATNTFPLVANRSTAVRVFLSTDATVATGPVTGVLTVTVDGNEITPAGGLLQILPVDAQPSPSRNVENHTLNFELPAPSGITASSDVDFAVTINYVNDTGTGNNTFSVDNLTCVELENPDLLFVRIDYTPLGLGLPALSTVEAGVGDVMVKGVFPVVDNDPDLYEPAVLSAMPFGVDNNGNDSIDIGTESSSLLSTLAVARDLTVLLGTHPLTYTFVYGWLNGSPMSGFGGLGQVGGFCAFGNTTITQYQRSYAHELGHNFGLNHNSLTITPDAGWDTGARLENHPIGNNTFGRIKPSTFVDIMNAGPPTNGTWVDVASYTFFYNRMLIETLLPEPVAMSAAAGTGRKSGKGVTASGALIVQGYFDEGGTKLLHLSPTLRLTNPARIPPRLDTGIFTAVVTNADDTQQAFPFDAKVCYERIEELQHGFFEVLIPVPPSVKVRSLEIQRTETRERMGGLIASRPPSVKILSPAQGSQLRDQTTVKWTADDPDTNPKDILFHIAYSPDGGSTWGAVGVNLTGGSYTFNSKEIPRAKDGKGLLKIYSCDGLNTVTDQVGGLTTAAGKK